MLNKVVKRKIYVFLEKFIYENLYKDKPAEVAGVFAKFVFLSSFFQMLFSLFDNSFVSTFDIGLLNYLINQFIVNKIT